MTYYYQNLNSMEFEAKLNNGLKHTSVI